MIKCRENAKSVSCVGDTPTQNGTISQIFGGTANRRLSEEDGLVVDLCPDCHNRPPNGVHFNKKNMEWMHRTGQRAFEDELIENGASPDEARQRFMERYGKNHL